MGKHGKIYLSSEYYEVIKALHLCIINFIWFEPLIAII